MGVGRGQQIQNRKVVEFIRGVTISNTGWETRHVSIEQIRTDGVLPDDIDAVATLGILRGTGVALQEAAARNIPRYYIDHAYFNPGYNGDGWLRISKNRHTVNYTKQVPDDRWVENFAGNNPIQPWRTRSERGNNILVLPPTDAVGWYFNDREWCDKIVLKLKKYVPESLIKIRLKPNEPVVNVWGDLKRLQKNPADIPLDEDLRNTNIVVAYNSSSALQAALMGIPVITNKHCAAYPISFSMSDLAQGPDNPVFDKSPNRMELVKWLSYCQFNRSEIMDGTAWSLIQEYQDDVDGY